MIHNKKLISIDVSYSLLETSTMIDAMKFLGLIPIRMVHQYEYERCSFICIDNNADPVIDGQIIPKAMIIIHKNEDDYTYELSYS